MACAPAEEVDVQRQPIDRKRSEKPLICVKFSPLGTRRLDL